MHFQGEEDLIVLYSLPYSYSALSQTKRMKNYISPLLFLSQIVPLTNDSRDFLSLSGPSAASNHLALFVYLESRIIAKVLGGRAGVATRRITWRDAATQHNRARHTTHRSRTEKGTSWQIANSRERYSIYYEGALAWVALCTRQPQRAVPTRLYPSPTEQFKFKGYYYITRGC